MSSHNDHQPVSQLLTELMLLQSEGTLSPRRFRVTRNADVTDRMNLLREEILKQIIKNEAQEESTASLPRSASSPRNRPTSCLTPVDGSHLSLQRVGNNEKKKIESIRVFYNTPSLIPPTPPTSAKYSKRMHIEAAAKRRAKESLSYRLPDTRGIFEDSERNKLLRSGALSMESDRRPLTSFHPVTTSRNPNRVVPVSNATVLPTIHSAQRPACAADMYTTEYARCTSIPAASRPVALPDPPSVGKYFHGPITPKGRIREVRTNDNAILETSPRYVFQHGECPGRGVIQTARTG